MPPFMYGTHYSTPGYVMYWLVRAAPAHMVREGGAEGGREGGHASFPQQRRRGPMYGTYLVMGEGGGSHLLA